MLRTHLRYSISLAPTELVVRNIFLIAMKLAREENMRVLVGVDKVPLPPEVFDLSFVNSDFNLE